MNIQEFIQLLVLGSIALSLLPLSVATINLLTARRVTKRKFEGDAKLAVLIPARNEEGNIGNILSDLVGQTYTKFSVFVLDDHSDDATAEVASKYKPQLLQLEVIEGKGLPSGWLGKPWACQQLAEAAADFDQLLFIDADVRLEKNAVESALELYRESNADLLSCFPTQLTETVGEAFFVTMVNWVLLSMLPLRSVERYKMQSLSAANGQFMLFNSVAYKQIGQHNAVKNRNTEDLELSILIQKYKKKLVVCLGANSIYCRMYKSAEQALNGISRSYYIGFGAKGPGFLMSHMLIVYAYVMPLLFLSTSPLCFIPIALTLATRTIVALQSNRNILFDLSIHLAQMFGTLGLATHSYYMFRTNSVTWKGRNINISAH